MLFLDKFSFSRSLSARDSMDYRLQTGSCASVFDMRLALPRKGSLGIQTPLVKGHTIKL